MISPAYWIDHAAAGRLGTMARPRGGDWLDDEIRALAAADVTALVSLLTAAENRELLLEDEAERCANHGLTFVSFPIPDFATPPLDTPTFGVVQDLAQRLAQQQTVVVHCRQGIGRSSLIAAATLTLRGMTPDSAFSAITAARGRPVPDTPAQRVWVERFAQRYGPGAADRSAAR